MDVPAIASATHPEHHHQAQPAASPAAARFFARLSLLACARFSALVGPGLPQCSTCLARAPAFPVTRPHLAQANGFGVVVGAAAGAREVLLRCLPLDVDRIDRNDTHVTPASSYVLYCEARTGLLRGIYIIYMVHGCIDRHPCIRYLVGTCAA